MLGYEPEELVGRLGPLDIVHPDDRRVVEERMQQGLEGKPISTRYVVRGIRKDGTVIEGEVFGRRIVSRGKPCLCGTVVNLTEKARLIESLRENERLLRAIFEAAPDDIIALDSAARIIAWNKGAERLFGYSADEICGKSLTLIMPPRFHQGFIQNSAQAVRTGKYRRQGQLKEVLCRRKDGGGFPAEVSLSLWNSKEGPRFVGIVRDITERKESLRRWQKFLKELVKALSLALQARDPYTARHQLRVAELAKAIAEELDLPPKRVEGVYIGALLHGIGKQAVPTEILSKPTKLTPTERSLVPKFDTSRPDLTPPRT